MFGQSLRARLFTAFVLLLTLEIFTGLISIQSLGNANSQARDVGQGWLPIVSRLGFLASSVEDYRLRESRVLLARSEAEWTSAEAELQAAKASVEKYRTALNAGIPSNLGSDPLLAKFDEVWGRHQAARDRWINGPFDARGLGDASRRLLAYKGQSDIDSAIEYVRQDLASSTVLGERAVIRGQSTTDRTLRFIYFAMVVSFVLSGLLGVYLANIIAQPLAHLTSAMRRMSNEELDIEVEEQDRRDELGVMARALNDFKNRLIDRRRLIEDEKRTLMALNQAQKELVESEKLASLGRLVAGISHEINTPLGSGYVLATTLVEGHRDFEQVIRENRLRKSDLETFVSMVGRAADLLEVTLRKARDLISTFKQVAVDQSSDNRRTFEIGELVRQVQMTVQPLFKGTPHRIEIQEGDKLTLDSYPGPLGQVINNLLANALTHAFEKEEPGTVIVRTEESEPGRLTLVVSDNGRGIPPEHLPHVFEPFFTTRLGQGGSGLGLNIVHGIVTRVLGGSIAIESEVGKGTTFTVEIPMVAPEKE